MLGFERRTTGMCLLAGGLLLAAGCTSAATSSPEPRPAPTYQPVSGALASACVNPTPPPVRAVAGPAGGATRNGRFTRSLILDGALHVTAPPPTARPAITAGLAECNLRAATTAQNFPVEQEVTLQGLTFGLAAVSLPDSLLHGHSLLDQGIGATGATHPPALHAYHHRLAWVAVTEPELKSSCPAQIPGPTAIPRPSARPPLPGYQVIVIDANTGGDGFIYSARTYQNCLPDAISPLAVTPAQEEVSVPWQLVSRHPDGYRATITIEVRSCDGVSEPFLASRGDPAIVSVPITRPLAGCGATRPRQVTLEAGTVTSALPKRLLHAPVGAIDAIDAID